jgi:uncharacterized membrane protein
MGTLAIVYGILELSAAIGITVLIASNKDELSIASQQLAELLYNGLVDLYTYNKVVATGNYMLMREVINRALNRPSSTSASSNESVPGVGSPQRIIDGRTVNGAPPRSNRGNQTQRPSKPKSWWRQIAVSIWGFLLATVTAVFGFLSTITPAVIALIASLSVWLFRKMKQRIDSSINNAQPSY